MREYMEERLFTDKNKKPNNAILKEELGRSFGCWEETKKILEKDHGKLIEEWKYYGQKYGWSMKYLYKKRNLFFFSAQRKYFQLGFMFGDKAAAAIEKSDLPEEYKEQLRVAKKYVEGRVLRLNIKKKSDIKYIGKLVDIKIKN